MTGAPWGALIIPAHRVMQTAKKQTQAAAPKVGFVSLGCAKALVDSERILTRLRAEGYAIAPDYDGADLVVVNTCGFLDSAKAESLEAIGEAIAENGRVIVTGCFGVEDKRIRDAFPDVLAVTGPHQYDAVMNAIHAAAPAPHAPFLDLVPRAGLRLTPPHYAYLKISEGCHNRCSFCIIPSIRGDLASRQASDVLAEAEALAAQGVKELLVISQDTSAYGTDLKYAQSSWRGSPVKARLTELCEALSELGVWVRLLYVYPYPHVDEVTADGGGQNLALSRYPVPACLALCAEGDAPPGEPGKNLGAYSALAGGLPRSGAPLDVYRWFPR